MRANVLALHRVVREAVGWLECEQPDDAMVATSGIGRQEGPFFVSVLPVSDSGAPLIGMLLTERTYATGGVLINPIVDAEAAVLRQVVEAHVPVTKSWVIPGGGAFSAVVDACIDDSLFQAIARYQSGCPVHRGYRSVFFPQPCTHLPEALGNLKRPEGWV